MSIYPVPTTRTSDILARSRLVSQLQGDQVELLRLQTQLSTGRRLQTPSDDPNAALRAQGLQRLLDLKGQDKANITTSQSYLNATDGALSSVSDLLNSARGIALSSVGSDVGATERQADAAQISNILDQMLGLGNQQFRGRYLFAGSRSDSAPFAVAGNYIAYDGNQGTLRSFADSNYLFDASMDGHSVFGAISSQQQGTANLQPILTDTTRLSDLNHGRGITPGSILVSDGASNSVIDVSSAHTIGDVAALIEAHPPAGRTLTARIGTQGLVLSLDSAGGGNLTVQEVGGGTTAAELGIASTDANGVGPLAGGNLQPLLRPTTSLANILGVRASGSIVTNGTNNDITFESKTRGTGENGVAVQFVDDSLLHASPGLTAGSETVSYSASAVAAQAAMKFSGNNNNLVLSATAAGAAFNDAQIVVENAGAIGNNATVSYDATNKVLHLGVDSTGATQIQTLINQINAEGTFTAAYDASDSADGGLVPTATISIADIGAVSGNTGNSGAAANTFRVAIAAGQSTANDVVAALNQDATFSGRFTAQIDPKDTSAPALAGKGAIDLEATGLSAGGSGQELDLASGLQIRNGDTTYTINVAGATTVEQLLNTINGAGANVLAEINDAGTGIDIHSRLSGADLSIGENGGTTATQLGLRSLGSATQLSSLNHGQGVASNGGVDFTIHRNDGVDLGISVAGATTVQDVIDRINNDPANTNPVTRVVARLAQFGNGIELVDDNPTAGQALSITQAVDSHAAEQLGLVPVGSGTSAPSTPAVAATAALDFAPANTDLKLTANVPGTGLNGVNVVFQNTLSGNTATASYNAGANTLTISLDSSATTSNTVLAAINAEGTFGAALDTTTDATNDGSGLVGATGTMATTAGGSAEQLTGSDTNPIEVGGVFSALLRMRAALTANDQLGLQRAAGLLDSAADNVTFAHGAIGARSQTLDTLSAHLDDEQVQLKKSLSDEVDVDFVQTVSDLTARQAAYQASLQLSAQLQQQTLLNYL
jgi:flagellin-like hook-associated protein FlgL